MKTIPKPVIKLFLGSLFALLLLIAGTPSWSFNFPAAGWHRGDVSVAQENSRPSISKALYSTNPNFETDIIDFVDQNGKRVGLVSHDYLMKRATGEDGAFSKKYNDLTKLPKNRANLEMPAEPFMTIIELFDLIKERKAQGVTPTVSLDMKDEGKCAEEFSQWVGKLIQQYGFEQHVFASSFLKAIPSPSRQPVPNAWSAVSFSTITIH